MAVYSQEITFKEFDRYDEETNAENENPSANETNHNSFGRNDIEVETPTLSQINQINHYLNSILKDFLEIVQKHMDLPPTVPKVDQLHPEYNFVIDANNKAVNIAIDTTRIHKFIRERYSKKFPELDQLLLDPLAYATVVQLIGNEMDISKVDLNGILSPAIIMVVTVAGYTTTGIPLRETELNEVLEACKLTIELDVIRKKIADYVENRMALIAPNLSAVVGSSLAARMISFAGGLIAFSKMPATSITTLGIKNATGLPTTPTPLVYDCDIVRKIPSGWKARTVRLVSGKIVLAARVDAFNQDPSRETGARFRDELEKKIEKWYEPQQVSKTLLILPPHPRRGCSGRRKRTRKLHYMKDPARTRLAFGALQFQNTNLGFARNKSDSTCRKEEDEC